MERVLRTRDRVGASRLSEMIEVDTVTVSTRVLLILRFYEPSARDFMPPTCIQLHDPVHQAIISHVKYKGTRRKAESCLVGRLHHNLKSRLHNQQWSAYLQLGDVEHNFLNSAIFDTSYIATQG
jgi:hypothetical protein